jgi:hypothetical protein
MRELRSRVADFTYNLRTFFAVIEIKIFRRSRAIRADRISRN